MSRAVTFTLAVLAAIAVASPASAQSGIAVNADLAKRGKQLFTQRGCNACHAIGKKLAGPDLAGVTARRDVEWLRRWLKTTDQMLESDSIAKAMLAEFQNVRMPNLKLSDAEIDALLNYLQQESDKRK